jgi:hypothetical protein
MSYNPQQANAITGGLWLIGIGVLFATRFWWPGILLLIGITMIAQGLVEGRGWYGLHGGFWMILIALWAMFRFSIAIFFIALGIYVIFSAVVKPGPFHKPYVDNTLE